MTITSVIGQGPIDALASVGPAFVGWNGDGANITGFATCDTPPTLAGPSSQQFANVAYVRAAINHFVPLLPGWGSGDGPGGDGITLSQIEQWLEDNEFVSSGTPHGFATEAWVTGEIQGISGGAHVSNTPPANAPSGRFWLRESDARLFVRYPQDPPTNGVWIEARGIGTQGGGGLQINAPASAAGNSQSTATAVSAGMTEVTGGAGGVRWHSAAASQQCIVHNATGEPIYFYPPTGAHINDEQPDHPMFIQANHTGSFVAFSATRLVSIP